MIQVRWNETLQFFLIELTNLDWTSSDLNLLGFKPFL